MLKNNGDKTNLKNTCGQLMDEKLIHELGPYVCSSLQLLQSNTPPWPTSAPRWSQLPVFITFRSGMLLLFLSNHA